MKSVARTDQPPARIVTGIFPCQLCGADAGRLQLHIYDQATQAKFVLQGVMGETTTWIAAEHIDALSDVLVMADARRLFEWDQEWASFYCPQCNRIYCHAHWRTEIAFDDDDELPGWYDCTYGTCPRGHRRILDD